MDGRFWLAANEARHRTWAAISCSPIKRFLKRCEQNLTMFLLNENMLILVYWFRVIKRFIAHPLLWIFKIEINIHFHYFINTIVGYSNRSQFSIWPWWIIYEFSARLQNSDENLTVKNMNKNLTVLYTTIKCRYIQYYFVATFLYQTSLSSILPLPSYLSIPVYSFNFLRTCVWISKMSYFL